VKADLQYLVLKFKVIAWKNANNFSSPPVLSSDLPVSGRKCCKHVNNEYTDMTKN